MGTLSGSARVLADTVAVELLNGQQVSLPHLWLRDNCPCDDCRVTQTQEKRFILVMCLQTWHPLRLLLTGTASVLSGQTATRLSFP